MLAGAKTATTGAINEASLTAASASLQNYNAMLSMEGLAASVSTVAMSAEQMKSFFQTTHLGGRLLGDWGERAFSKGVKQSILQSLRESQVMGQGTSNMVKRLLQNAIDDGFALTKREAITLARTYTQTANVEAQMAAYKKNEDLIYAYKRISILDTSVCPRCGALDGMMYKKDEKRPPMPLHPRCRCLWQALMRIEDLGISREDLEKVARPWARRELKNIDEGGKRKINEAGKTTEYFGEWWKTLPAKEQEYSVGKTRARLLREGKVKFGELVDKETGRLRPLDDLGFGRDGIKLPPIQGGKKFDVIEIIASRERQVAEDVARAMKLANPHFGENEGYRRNCVNCVPAYILRRFGYDVEARPSYYPYDNRLKNGNLFGGWQGFKNIEIDGAWVYKRTITKNDLLAKLHSINTNEKVGIIWTWKDMQRSHTIACEKDEAGNLLFVDPQSGQILNELPDNIYARTGFTYYKITSLEIDESFPWNEIIRKPKK